MASQREMVSFQGVLKAQGVELRCVGSAMKVTLPGTNGIEHTNFDIHNVFGGVPQDGTTYELIALGKTIRVKYQGGNWLSASA
jgi:hypothetical protein